MKPSVRIAIVGTWHENHYPGCACDVQSALYSFSFEQNPNWTCMYARQEEIKAYLKHCAEKYGLMDHIHLNTHVAGARFDENRHRWTVETCDAPLLWDYMTKRGMVAGDELDRSDEALPEISRAGAGQRRRTDEWHPRGTGKRDH
jgi:cyclohexanone monooxygenase